MVQYIDLELHCEMDFYQFPFDTQVCRKQIIKDQVKKIIDLPKTRNASTWYGVPWVQT